MYRSMMLRQSFHGLQVNLRLYARLSQGPLFSRL